jgi:putative membrane protein
MKSLLRNTIIYAFTLSLLPQVLPGVTIRGGFVTYLFGGLALTLMLLLLKPLLNLISFPLNLISLGLFSILTNLLILYLLTVFVPHISVNAFTFPGFSFAGFVIPRTHLNAFFAFAAASAVLSAVTAFIEWLTN